MIIKKLTLHNFGVYAATQVFEFDSDKPVALIGGLNGRGKTTFLDAVLISLYGAKSFAYKESKFKTYGAYLRSLINKDSWSQDSYIELQFELDQSGNENYTIRRDWNGLSQRVKEKIYVEKNGVESPFLAENWAMFIENVLPSALTDFFFFDGEKIAELAVDASSAQIKESIRAMLGISVLDVLRNDLERNLKKTNKDLNDNELLQSLDELRDKKDKAVERLSEIDSAIESSEELMQTHQQRLEQLKIEYEAIGGVLSMRIDDLDQKRIELSSQLLQNKNYQLDLAAQALPLILVKDLLGRVEKSAQNVYEQRISKIASDRITELFNDYKKRGENVGKSLEAFLAFVSDYQSAEVANGEIELSDQALYQLKELLHHKLEEQREQAYQSVIDKQKLTVKSNEIESYLSADINEEKLKKYYHKQKLLEKKIMEIEEDLAALRRERSAANGDVIRTTSDFNRNVEKVLNSLEYKDDSERVIRYSHIAIKVLDAFSIELQKRKTEELAVTITNCYKKLANKTSLIDRIEMDPKELDLKYLDHEGKIVEKTSLSAGEKQLMVISILWALAICSKKKLPVIIDTPLSRLDSTHRTSLVTKYFPHASDQTIILSTDSEIDLKYYEMMKDYIGDEFTLKYDDETRSTSIIKGYFAG